MEELNASNVPAPAGRSRGNDDPRGPTTASKNIDSLLVCSAPFESMQICLIMQTPMIRFNLRKIFAQIIHS